jgi:hypothetical protein
MGNAHYHGTHWIGQVGGGGDPPTAPTLSIADQEDGTGATATVSGGDADATHTIYVSVWPGGSFADEGDRVGNGTVDLSLTTGPYWAYCEASNDYGTASSDMVAFRVTDGSESVLYQCLEAVRDVIRGLSLAGVSSDDIVFRKLPWDREIDHPGVIVYPAPEAVQGATNLRDDVGYAIQVATIRVSNHDLVVGLDVTSLWRQQIRRALHAKPLSGVSEVYTARVEPKEVTWGPGFQNMYDVGLLTVRLIAREPQTVA